MNPFTILGVTDNCSVEIAKKAYRALAQKHHPDKGGSEKQFKEIKAAWEQIETGYCVEKRSYEQQWARPESPESTWYKQTTKSYRDDCSKPQEGAEVVSYVGLREAFTGYNMVIQKQTKTGLESATIAIPPGLPDGHRGRYRYNTNSTSGDIIITARINTGYFKLRGQHDQDNIFSAGLYPGDIEVERELDAIDLITGCWITVEDFLGEKLSVRVPEGFNPLSRLKIAKKGYYGWSYGIEAVYPHRQNMFVRVKPVFNRVADIEKQKIIDLYNVMQRLNES